MKKDCILIFMVLLFQIPLIGQTPYFCEEFNDGQGWTLDDNWSIASGELRFYWSPTITNFDCSAISPSIYLVDNSQEIIVNQYLDAFGASTPSEAAEIIVIADGDEYLLWNYELSNGNWGQANGTDLVLDISDFSGQDVQFKFRTYGPSTYEWNWWDIFSFQLTSMLEADLTATAVEGPAKIGIDETGQWDVAVTNLGSQAQSDFTIKLFSFKYGDMVGSMDISEAIQPLENKNFSFEWTPEIGQSTALYGVVVLEGDEYEFNNVSSSHFVRVDPGIDYNIFVWDFDNSIETITDPEQGDEIQPSTGLTRALDAAVIDYEMGIYLPDNLDAYDIVFSTMGCYCVS